MLADMSVISKSPGYIRKWIQSTEGAETPMRGQTLIGNAVSYMSFTSKKTKKIDGPELNGQIKPPSQPAWDILYMLQKIKELFWVMWY